MKKTAMAIMTIIIVMIWALSANAESTEFVGCKIRITREIVAENGEILSPGSIFTILSEEEEKFQIEVDDEKIFVNSSEVFINVKDYIPSIEVDLVMADKAIFQMGGESIPGLWGEKFYNTPGAESGTEAWLTVQAAQKLAKAQEMFLQDGKSIVINDAYRPYSVTKEFQSRYRAYLNTKTESFKKKWFGSLGESWFLAQKASSHNYGIAVDITLRDLSTGCIMEMPAPMHNLDIRSAESSWINGDSKECENAKYLASVMKKCGMKTLKSEWWHFQDGSAPKSDPINIPN